MSETHDLEAIYREVIAAVNRHDVDGILALFTEDAEVVNYAEPTVSYEGQAAIAELLKGTFEASPDTEFDVIDVVAAGTRLAAELRLRATPPGGSAPVEVQCCGYYQFQGGKVLSEHLYLDAGQMGGVELSK